MYWCCNNLVDIISKDNVHKFNACREFFNQFKNPLLIEWNPPKLCFTQGDDRRIKYKTGDCHRALSGYPYLISQNMIDKIGDVLGKYGLWLPLEVEGREEDKLYRYWVTNELECMDREKSIIETSWAHEYITINKLVVDEERYDGSMIFRVKDKQYIDNTYFVTSEFIELIKHHNLKGFEFYQCAQLTKLYYRDTTFPDGPDKPILIG